MSAVLPFFLVLGKSLGIPIEIQGSLTAGIMVTTLIAKPLIAMVADTFSALRKTIFIFTVVLSGLSFSSIYFIPSVGTSPDFSSAVVVPKVLNMTNGFPNDFSYGFTYAEVQNSLGLPSFTVDNLSLSDALVLVPTNGEQKYAHYKKHKIK